MSSSGRGTPRSPRAIKQNFFAISSEEVELVSELGKGSFGQVFKGKCRGQEVAIKVLKRQKLSAETLTSFKNEVTIISLLRHPNVVQFMGACYEPGNLMIVTEFVPHGDLHSLLLNRKIELNLATRMKMARDIALGMNWLHLSTPQFIHRDLKTTNLLIDSNYRIKICDFGLAQIKPPGGKIIDEMGPKGTPLWMAPETLLQQEITDKCDVYGFGVILWSLLTRKEPFSEFKSYNEFAQAIAIDHYRPKIPNDCEPALCNLITSCWQHDPRLRPSFSTIVDEINKIIIDVSIKDKVGNAFWNDRYFGKESILMEDFLFEFQDYLADHAIFENFEDGIEKENAKYWEDITDEQLKSLSDRHLFYMKDADKRAKKEFVKRYGTVLDQQHLTLTEDDLFANIDLFRELLLIPSSETVDGNEMATIERFGFITNLFGPIVDPETNRVLILEKVRRYCSQKWFHGDIDRVEAENRIRVFGDGNFLIRFSSQSGEFAISYSFDKSIQHRRITYKPSVGYLISDSCFKSLELLIAGTSKHLKLKYPCPGSRFHQSSETSVGYVQSNINNN